MDRNSPPQACASCHEEIPPRARFCPFCGAAAPNAAPRAEDGGEHRQLTVMFCDLMGSTVLSHELEAEDLQDVLRTYQAICARAIESRAGMIAKYQGDGVMAYFGFPQATEDSPIRAVEAALEIVREVGRVGATLQTRDGIDFATRIALHTGRVLIGEMGAGGTRERHALTGIVPNLAARLEGVAPRNGVVISSQTRAMVTRAFRTESLGPQMLKGFAGPVEAHRVLGRRAALAVLPARSAPVVGREAELAVLRNCWQRTAAGEITRIAVIAEPGAGKSALATAFLSDSEIEQGRVIEFSGTLSDANTPFAALRQTIERWTAFAQMRSAELPQTQIAKWFGHESIAESPHANTFHRLWQGPMEPGSEGRAQIFDACRTLLGALPKPLLVVIEDAHWLDPSSFEMLDSISAQTPGMMVLLLSRPGHAATAKAENVIRLDSLDSDACRALVEQVAGAPVESGLLRRIIDVANGLPLFIEEYTKSLLEAGKIREERGTVRPTDLRTEIVTPASLLDLITMRLDSLGPVKQVAQIGATLGRSFSQEALAAVAGESEEAIENAVTRLTGSGLLSRDWSGRLTFDHALFQKVAYESLVRAARQKWHARYIDWLAARPNRMKSVPPETIGFHLEACGRPLEAVMHYLEAGLSANAASASLEAAVHFGKCCDLLHRVPPEDTPDALPLRAQVLLAGALLSARGPGADETRAAYDRAVTLAEATPESEWHFAAYWGWWRVSESFAQMNERAGRLLRISESMRGQEFRLQSLHCVWANAFQMGAFGTSIENAREGLALYDEGRFEDIGTLYGGHDCKVCAHGEIALASWLQGAGDGATGELRTALGHAEHLDHLGSLLHGLDIAVMLHHYRRDTGAVREIADRLRDLGARNDLEDYRAKGEIFAGWVDIEAGQVRQGLGRVDEGFETLRAIGTPEDFPVYQCIRAAALTRLGDHDGALAVLADGRAIVATEGVNYWGAELARNEALVEMARRDPDPGFIEARLQEALSLAASQGALALELRAAISLFGWKRERGDAAEARRTLAAVRARFDSAATGADLAAADALLAAPASQHAR